MQHRYEILSASNPRELERHVNTKLETGWKPVGGVAVNSYIDSILGYSRTEYHQAVRLPLTRS